MSERESIDRLNRAVSALKEPVLTHTRPCPFCGDQRSASVEEVPMTYDPPNLFVAVCQCCGAQGPMAKTRGAALVCWDERRAPGDTAGFIALSDRLAGCK